MKIAVIANYIISREIERKLGIDKTGDRRRSTGTVNLSRGLARIPGVELHHVCPIPYIRSDRVIDHDNMYIHFISVPRRVSVLSLLEYPKRKIHQMLSKIEPDIVHGHHAEHGYTYYAITSGYEAVAGIHNHIPNLMRINRVGVISKWRLFRIFEEFTLRHAKYVTVDSEFMETLIVSKTSAKVFRIPCCVDERFFKTTSIGETNEPSVLFVGIMRREKGLDTLLEAMSFVRDDYSDVTLRIIGQFGSEMMQQVDAAIERLGLGKTVLFLGWMEWEQMITEMSKAQVVVVPSTYEPFGCTVVEGMALGKAVVGSNVGGISENIEDGETGLLFEVGNARDLASKLSLLLSDRDYRWQLGRNAAERARSSFHPDVVAGEHYRLYERILAGQE